MIDRRLRSKLGIALSSLVMTACASQHIEIDVPDLVLQHTLSSLTSKQSYVWYGSPGHALIIHPLGTFRSGDYYCRDYEIGREDARGKSLRRTACRFDKRWTNVDPSSLDT